MSNPLNLSREDVEFLIECCDAKVTTESQSDIMGELMFSMLGPKNVSGALQAETIKQRLDERRRKRKPLTERCILLKAKLIQLRDAMDVHRLLESTLTEKNP